MATSTKEPNPNVREGAKLNPDTPPVKKEVKPVVVVKGAKKKK